MTFNEWVILHHQKQPLDDLRMGQRFYNEFGIKGDLVRFDGLYEASEKKAQYLIRELLEEWQYWPDMPPPRGK